MRRALLFALLFALLLLPAGAEERKISKIGFALDTVVSVTAYGGAEGAAEEALALCHEYERLLSKTFEGSDVWRINHAGGEPVEVSEATAEVLALALRISALSDGAFDITIAPAVALWDFTGARNALPDARALEEAVARVDYRKLMLEGNLVALPAGMQIDLGGIAKGYIADRVADHLRARGVKSGLINLGGNVIALGTKPEGRWKIGIQDPAGGPMYKVAVSAEDISVVTSGTYERGFDLDGVRYHHILDTATGYPVQNGLSSATVIAAESALADALSTAIFSLGIERGAALIEGYPGAEAIFITDAGEVILTSGAGALIVE